MMMTKQLPFDVQPTAELRSVGDGERTGTIKLPVIRGVRLAERLYVMDGDDTDQLFRETAELAVRIASERDVEVLDAYKMLNRVLANAQGVKIDLAPVEFDLIVRYGTEIEDLSARHLASNQRQAVRAATALIRSRVPGMEEWTDQDTCTLHEGLIRALHAFYLAEAAGMSEELDPDAAIASLTEALGKWQPGLGDPPPNPTGEPSSGSSSTTSPESQASPANGSPSSPSPSSSRPSKKPSDKSGFGFTGKSSPSPS